MWLIHIAERARSRAARVAAGSAGAASRGCRRGGAFGGDRKDRELRRQLGRVAFGTLRFFLAVEQRFELVVTFLADVFVDGHKRLRIYLY